MNGELRGIFIAGQEVRGVQADGWGSQAKLKIDLETNEVKQVEREPTNRDALFAAHYLSFLEQQFSQEGDNHSPSKVYGDEGLTNDDGDFEIKHSARQTDILGDAAINHNHIE